MKMLRPGPQAAPEGHHSEARRRISRLASGSLFGSSVEGRPFLAEVEWPQFLASEVTHQGIGRPPLLSASLIRSETSLRR